jgi:hypothetical protein
MTRSTTRPVLWFAGILLLGLALVQPAAAAPPQRATVYKVPSKIKSDCSVPVDATISAWLATVPNNSTVQFGSGRCYGQDGTITLSGRIGLVIDGQGSEFRALTPGGSHRANWRFTAGANLTVQNMAVRGSNPTGQYVHEVEWQHGYSVEGVQGMTLSNVQARDTWGDGIFVYHGASSPACGDDASSARNVLITRATLERNGRQGVAVSDAEHVTLQDSVIGPVAWWSVDIETDDNCQIARHINILRNQFGANRYGVIGSVGWGGDPQVGDLTVIDNTQTVQTAPPGECWAPVWVLSPVDAEGRVTAYRKNYVFRGNRFLGKRNGFEFRGVDNIEVSANTVTLTPTIGCGTRAGMLLAGTHTVGITSNVFSGANNVFLVRDPPGSLSTGITSTGNSTG